MSSEIAALAAQLERRIEPLRDVLVAVSGGVDSTVVAELAFRSLGSRALIMTADSPAVPRRDIEEVGRLAAQRGWNHRFVRTNELDRPGYRQNASDRCYHCKSELFDVMIGHPEARGATVLTGTNAEDLGDHRPGLRAAAERAVIAPLAEAGVDKAGVRALARHLQLPTAERPASPCLASRVAYGVEVDHETLDRIERAESLLRSLGYPVCRVRVHGDVARVEVPGAQLEAAFAQRHRFAAALRRLGFTYVTLDLEGFRSGSLNESLPIVTISSS